MPLLISRIISLILLVLLVNEPSYCQSLLNAGVGSSVNLCIQAAKQYLSGKGEESIALYQTAIARSENEFGKNSRITGMLNYELGVRALSLSKYGLAEHCLKRAVEINPNSEPAQLMLVQLLRLRNKDSEAYAHAQQVLKKHWDSKQAHKDILLCMQEKDPASAAQEAFIINCLQTGTISRIQKQTIQIPHTQPVTKLKPAQLPKPAVAEPKPNKSANLAKNRASKVESKAKAEQKVAPKPKAQPKSELEPKPRTEPKTQAKQKRRHEGNQTSGSHLVPPPPPSLFGFPTATPSSPTAPSLPSPPTALKASAGSIKGENSKTKKAKAERKPARNAETQNTSASEKPAETQGQSQHNPFENDPDFLIEWANVKKKK